MKVAIHGDNGEVGYVLYIEGDHTVMVTCSNDSIRNKVHQYLVNTKEFIIPGSSRIGDRRIIEEKPSKNIDLMNMALCEMYTKIGVHVDWNNPNNIFDSLTISKENLSTNKSNKPIIKSIDDTQSFEIIN